MHQMAATRVNFIACLEEVLDRAFEDDACLEEFLDRAFEDEQGDFLVSRDDITDVETALMKLCDQWRERVGYHCEQCQQPAEPQHALCHSCELEARR